MKNDKLEKVIFVGGFSKGKDGSIGGQTFACMSLLDSPISNEVKWIKIDSSMRGIPPPGIILRAWDAFARILKFLCKLIFEKPDIALIFSASGLSLYEKGIMVIMAEILGIPAIFAPRGSGIAREKGLLLQISKFFLKKATLIFCQSNQWKSFYLNLTNFPEERVMAIPNWIDAMPYVSMRPPPERPVLKVLYLGYMVRLKGIFDLIDVVASDKAFFRNTKFIMCGCGNDVDDFKKKAEIKKVTDNFELKGWVDGKEKLAIIEDSDIFVLPSYGEGMPNSLLEAMAAGRATIATSVGGIPDMITHGENGFIFQPGDTGSLSELLKSLILNRNMRLEFGDKARKRVLEFHDINNCWHKVKEAFKISKALKKNKVQDTLT